MLQTTDPMHETADAGAQVAALREALATARREVTLLRAELERLRRDNARLRSMLHDLAAPTTVEMRPSVQMETTAGTSIGPRRH